MRIIKYSNLIALSTIVVISCGGYFENKKNCELTPKAYSIYDSLAKDMDSMIHLIDQSNMSTNWVNIRRLNRKYWNRSNIFNKRFVYFSELLRIENNESNCFIELQKKYMDSIIDRSSYLINKRNDSKLNNIHLFNEHIAEDWKETYIFPVLKVKTPEYCRFINGSNMDAAIIKGFNYMGKELPVLVKIYKAPSVKKDVFEEYFKLLLENREADIIESYYIQNNNSYQRQITASLQNNIVELIYINKLSTGNYYVGYSKMSLAAFENIGHLIAATFVSTKEYVK